MTGGAGGSDGAVAGELGVPPLSDVFPTPSRSDWESAVETALKGASVGSLRSATEGGIDVEPIYTRDQLPVSPDASGFPGSAPFTRGTASSPRPNGAWDVRRVVDLADATAANRQALTDLERGVTSLEVEFPPATAADLGSRLEGVFLDLAPVVLRAGFDFEQAAAALESVWSDRGVAPDAAVGGFGADPLATMAAHGDDRRSVDELLAAMASLAARTADTYPLVRAVTVSTLPAVDAGATEVQELAVMLATGAAYLRAMSAAGMSADAAASQIEVTLAADADVFTTMAKLRAARRLWSALTGACGASDDAGRIRLHARTARRMLTTRDPWVNLLRVTAAAFAAGVAGADSVTTDAYDALLADQSEVGRRMARNTQLLLLEESGLGHVVDPAGGSAYVETLTDQIADASWTLFQQLETSGGMSTVLIDGTLAARITDARRSQEERVANRRRPITGVSEFPNLDEPTPKVAATTVGTPLLVPVRWAEDYEDLRDVADAERAAGGPGPEVYLANLGPVAVHTARATFARNLFEAGGIRAVTSEAGATTGDTDPAQIAADAVASGARLACLCSSDQLYAEHAVAVAAALRDAGIARVYLAGRPGDERAELEAAGVDEFVHVGCDVLGVLRRALAEYDLHAASTEGGAR